MNQTDATIVYSLEETEKYETDNES